MKLPLVEDIRLAWNNSRYFKKHKSQYRLFDDYLQNEGWDTLHARQSKTILWEGSPRREHNLLLGYREIKGVPWILLCLPDHNNAVVYTPNKARQQQARLGLQRTAGTGYSKANSGVPEPEQIFLYWANDPLHQSISLLSSSLERASRPHSSLEGSLHESGMPESTIGPIIQAVDAEINRLEIITLDTLVGVRGGAVGRVHLPNGSYVIKVQTDRRMAYKDAAIPHHIHQSAQSNAVCAQLARRIPQPILAEPVEYKRFFVTLAEDVSGKQVNGDAVDSKIMEPLLRKGYPVTVVEMLYTAALFHEAVASMPALAFREESVPFVMPVERVMDRLASDAARKISPRQYREWQEEIESYHTRGTLLGLVDNRQENYVGGYFVDFGLAAGGSELPDLVRPLLLAPAYLKRDAVNDYIAAYTTLAAGFKKFSLAWQAMCQIKIYLSW